DLISTFAIGSTLPVATTDLTIVERSTVARRDGSKLALAVPKPPKRYAAPARTATPTPAPATRLLVFVIDLSRTAAVAAGGGATAAAGDMGLDGRASCRVHSRYNAGAMVIGVPRETLPGEHRVALVPASVPALVKAGAEVLIEAGAGAAAGFPDAEYAAKGATIA